MAEEKQYEKNTMIVAKSSKTSVNEAGKKRTEFSLTPEMTITLVEELQKHLVTELGSKRGVKFDVHVSKKTSNTGKEFERAILFTRPIQDPATFTGGASKQNFKQQPAKAFDVNEKIRKMKESMGKPVA